MSLVQNYKSAFVLIFYIWYLYVQNLSDKNPSQKAQLNLEIEKIPTFTYFVFFNVKDSKSY